VLPGAARHANSPTVACLPDRNRGRYLPSKGQKGKSFSIDNAASLAQTDAGEAGLSINKSTGLNY
jgi:hypothetical protein